MPGYSGEPGASNTPAVMGDQVKPELAAGCLCDLTVVLDAVEHLVSIRTSNSYYTIVQMQLSSIFVLDDFAITQRFHDSLIEQTQTPHR